MQRIEDKEVIYEFDGFVLDPRERTLTVNGAPVHLPEKEFETLSYLVENSGKALTKEELISAIWQDAFVEESNLAKQISRLRKVLGASGNELIETIPKHGYRLKVKDLRIREPEILERVIVEKRTLKRMKVAFPESPDEKLVAPLRPLVLRTGRRSVLLLVGILLLSAAGYFYSFQGDGATINSMAVLPLRALSSDENTKLLGLGLTDTLITKLGSLRQIVVRPISAVMPYADAPQDSLEVGKKLNVDAVLEGTVQHFEGRLRFNVRLLRVANGEQIWAEQFEGDATQIFDLQDRLTAYTAEALKLKLGSSENEQITKRFTNDPEALEAYLKGRYFSDRRTAGDLRIAIGYFNQAVSKDSNYALAYAGLADAYSLLADYNGARPGEAYPKAKAAATRALELDAELAEAHTSVAYVEMYYYREWHEAEERYRRALQINPNYATARQWYAEYLTAMGRFEEALEETRRAKDIDPLSPIINAGEVWTLYFARRYDEAIERGSRIAKLNPHFAEVHEYLKRCFDQKGMYSEAIASRQTRRKLAGLDAAENPVLKQAAAASDPKEYWKKRLEQEIEEGHGEQPEFFNMAEIYAQLGETDLAFEFLDRAITERDYEVMYLRVAPNLDPLRADPRFADALRRVRLLN